MSYLLDTHIALWALLDDPRLSALARGYITDPKTNVSVSAASIWEISIKHALGQKRSDSMPISGQQALDLFGQAGFSLLAISAKHAAMVSALPPLHHDPFDRMIVAQAIADGLVLLTSDSKLPPYHAGIILV
jgi:PIN domain nuclease of toxin-antitoxin system